MRYTETWSEAVIMTIDGKPQMYLKSTEDGVVNSDSGWELGNSNRFKKVDV
ncbi:unnamed protein product [Dovyalis caffra]|uniref:Uncharacterized protein n=1 Tax=Dovyalis caffra TaxID=77055 RepID=A0AAV1RZ07_9ROSI|nr:unnamed protein product [Dovyalis caffra]